MDPIEFLKQAEATPITGKAVRIKFGKGPSSSEVVARFHHIAAEIHDSGPKCWLVIGMPTGDISSIEPISLKDAMGLPELSVASAEVIS